MKKIKKKENTLKISLGGKVEEKNPDFQELQWRLKMTVIHRCKALQNWILICAGKRLCPPECAYVMV